MIVASETAQFGQPEINLGVIPGAGGTQRLTRTIGKALAMEMALNDRRLTADEAARFGLVNHVAPVAEYLDVAIKLAAEIAARAPLAVRLAKDAVNMAWKPRSRRAGLRAQPLLRTVCYRRPKGRHGGLLERKPAWRGK